MIGPDEFQCAMCGEVFYKGRSDEEAATEAAKLFPGIENGPTESVCDDCFQNIRPSANPEQYMDYLRHEGNG